MGVARLLGREHIGMLLGVRRYIIWHNTGWIWMVFGDVFSLDGLQLCWIYSQHHLHRVSAVAEFLLVNSCIVTCCYCKSECLTVRAASGNGSYLTAEQFMWFLNQEQRDPRLNEIIHPLCDIDKAQSLITKFEPDERLADSGTQMCLVTYFASRKFNTLKQFLTKTLHHFHSSSAIWLAVAKM